MNCKIAVAVVMAATLLFQASAAAEERTDYIHFSKPFEVHVGDITLQLEPGYYFRDDRKAELDKVIKDAQDEVTRLRAENKSFREQASEVPLTIVVITGIVAAALGVGAGFIIF